MRPTYFVRPSKIRLVRGPMTSMFVVVAAVLIDATSGAVQERIEICGDADDVFVDPRRDYIYVACGQGAIDVLAHRGDRTTRLARVETRAGARTALFSAELDRLFVAVRAAGSDGASLWQFRPVDNP